MPKGGKRHSALSQSLPKIKDGFIKQGHQFAVDKLNERSRNVLGSGLKRIAKDALGAKTDEEFQQHDDRAAGLINKYVLSEAKFDEKDADVFYDQFLKDAGVPSEADQKKALTVGQFESVSGEVSDSWAGEARLSEENPKNTRTSKEGNQTEQAVAVPQEDQENTNNGDQSQQKDKPLTSATPEEIGQLSEKYETNKDAVATISSGKGDPGGVSYGRYQMTSVTNGVVGGTVGEFVTSEGFPWKDEFKGLTPGSDAFSAKWKEISQKHPKEFAQQQHTFIDKKEYGKIKKRSKAMGIDVESCSKTVQQVFWSTAVQHGGGTSVISKAVKQMKKDGTFDTYSKTFESDLVNAIYDERYTRCHDCSNEIKNGFRKRIIKEREDALGKLKSNENQQ